MSLPSRPLALGDRTLVMGVLNVTPDSFSDGGLYLRSDAALRHALQLESAGVDILDVGGESTRPGSLPVEAEAEFERVVPLIRRLRRRLKITLSIDTRKAVVAEAALRAGAEIVNDVSGLRNDPDLARIARRYGAPLILMHMRRTPQTMQQRPFARDVLADVRTGLSAAVRRALRAGLRPSQLLIDPGLGFGKSSAQNYQLLAHLPRLARLGFPLVVGPSRKTFIGDALGGLPPADRAWGTAAAVTAAILRGAHIVRVHDPEMVQVARVADQVVAAARPPGR
ncbi:MAG TPA: dihydropteroate synthase [Candidatus Acidoferrales bacterium]|nr:dihydropteroate synthase [Candidatus Acidoferrales bacterium]